MKPTPEKIKRELKRLRKIVETSSNTESRVAYAVEHAIRLATEETVGWNAPSKDISRTAILINTKK